MNILRELGVEYSATYKGYWEKPQFLLHIHWKGVKSIISLRSNDYSTPLSININSNLISDLGDIAGSFNNYFSSIADKLRGKNFP